MTNRTLVLFDFDGTITTHDTLFLFSRFVSGHLKFSIGLILLSPILLAYKLGMVTAQRSKEIFLTYFLKGLTIPKMEKYCIDFCNQVLMSRVRTEALNEIRKHRAEGARVIVVSASAEDWILPWATKNGLEVIASKLEKVNGVLTGHLDGLNCNGKEKAIRILDRVHLYDYNRVIAYGDSKGDLEMFKLASETYFRPFQDRN